MKLSTSCLSRNGQNSYLGRGEQLSRLYDRLNLLIGRPASLLLHHAMGLQKVVYLLWAAPAFLIAADTLDLDARLGQTLNRVLDHKPD